MADAGFSCMQTLGQKDPWEKVALKGHEVILSNRESCAQVAVGCECNGRAAKQPQLRWNDNKTSISTDTERGRHIPLSGRIGRIPLLSAAVLFLLLQLLRKQRR